MKKIFKEVAKFLVAIVLGLVYMWFVLSYAWSIDEMSQTEKILGMAYIIIMVPMYCCIKRFLRLS